MPSSNGRKNSTDNNIAKGRHYEKMAALFYEQHGFMSSTAFTFLNKTGGRPIKKSTSLWRKKN